MKKTLYLLLICCFLTGMLLGCGEKKSSAPSANPPVTTQKAETAAPAPKIEQATAFRKANTTLKESDIVNLSIRNVEYDEKNKTFKKELSVYVDTQKKSFHDVKAIGDKYYQLTVDLPSNTAGGNVSVTYGESKSNIINFAFK